MLRYQTPRTMRLAKLIRELGPYAAIEILLPGGSLIALSLWAIHRSRFAAQARRTLRVLVAFIACSRAPWAVIRARHSLR
jgi:hypothetical protein